MTTPLRILVLGASYGSLLGTKLALAGHHVTLVCLPAEAELINSEGAVVRMPVKGRQNLLEVNSKTLPGTLQASGPAGIVPSRFDLVALAMQEPQYGAPGVRELLAAVARARVPVMSIMNMPPLPYLKRIPGLDTSALQSCFTDPSVWAGFDPEKFTLCSPDPQAFRPPNEPVNVLQVRLPTNFKAARFAGDADTAILTRLEHDIAEARYSAAGQAGERAGELQGTSSLFLPMAKWAMLLAGNYRCVQADGMRAIKDAVHTDIAATRAVYEWVADLCVSLGAAPGDMVPFEKYAVAAQSLLSPSSAARALAAGAQNIERVDKLVQAVAAQKGRRLAAIDETVSLVDGWLTRNRAKAA